MVALIFLLIVLPCILIIATFIWFCVLSIDAIYDVGMSLYEGRKPINKYRQ